MKNKSIRTREIPQKEVHQLIDIVTKSYNQLQIYKHLKVVSLMNRVAIDITLNLDQSLFFKRKGPPSYKHAAYKTMLYQQMGQNYGAQVS